MSNTTNLGLFKHDNPATNTNAFDVKSALNDNWDKIDNYAGNTNTAITKNENNIEALQVENAKLKETLPTTKGNGETITLNKTAEMDFIVPPLPEGNTVQDGEPTPTNPQEVQVVKGNVEVKVENKNLLDKENEISQGSTNNADDTTRVSIRVKHKLKANTTYTVITNLNTGNFLWAFVLGTKVSPWSNAEQLYDTGWKNTNYWSYTTSQECYINIPIRNSSNTNININDVKDYWVMLYEGAYNSNVSYEPYQEQKLPLYLPVENLFDKDNMTWVRNNDDRYTNEDNVATNRIRTHNLIKLKVGETYTISGFPQQLQLGFVKFYENPNATVRSGGTNTETFTVPTNAPYVIFQFNGTGFTDETNTLMASANIMLEQGSKANAYTPYGTEPIELCKIGDYKDYFYKDNGKWYLHKAVGKIVLDGTETILSGASVGTNTRYIISYTGVTNVQALCNQYKYLAHYTNDSEHFYFSNNQIIIFDSAGNAEVFKNKLATNKPEFYYILAQPTDIEITDTTIIEQLEAINNAMSYYEQTNISGTSSGISPLFDVETYQNTKLLLEDIINSN